MDVFWQAVGAAIGKLDACGVLFVIFMILCVVEVALKCFAACFAGWEPKCREKGDDE